MSQKKKPTSHLSSYFRSENSVDRIACLRAASKSGETLALDEVEDLCALDLSDAEKTWIVKLASAEQNLDLEAFLIRLTLTESQNVGVAAVENWAASTDRCLYFVWSNVVASPHVSQRVKFRIIERMDKVGCHQVLNVTDGFAHIDDYSEAFHRILLTRAVQWNYASKVILDLAQSYLGSWSEQPHLHTSMIGPSMAYLQRFDAEGLKDFSSKIHSDSIWADYLQVLILNANLKSQKSVWKPVWQRHELTNTHIEKMVQDESTELFEFSGIPSDKFRKFFDKFIQSDITKSLQFFEKIEVFLLPEDRLKIHKTIVKHIQSVDNPLDILTSISPRTRIAVQMIESGSQEARNLVDLQEKIISDPDISNESLIRLLNGCRGKKDVSAGSCMRHVFFSDAYLNSPIEVSNCTGQDYWALAYMFWNKPNLENLDSLTKMSRKIPSVWRQTFVKTLSRLKGKDEVVLKTLDFCRSEEEGELRTIFTTLREIDTSKASMELVNYLTRPNVSVKLKFEIAELLKSMELTKIQSELRSAIQDLQDPQPELSEVDELRQALQDLISLPTPSSTKDTAQKTVESDSEGDVDLDVRLKKQFQYFPMFSSEVKRALRTACFFDQQVTASSQTSNIDLSPVVDMQYKAMELMFRELFEKATMQAIRSGKLQRKLDMVGYARPIEQEMSRFESYLANLPIISTIPYFSKFKLRKMLRAISQFRPGKRFTLDGLKAFGLFFLVFGRSQDAFGMEGLLDLPFANDRDLCLFCKQLHEFQDLRNRAAHEGFHPDASQNVQAIWDLTSTVSEIAWDLAAHLSGSSASKPKISYSA